ncbi:hypothetical protein N658DRAFT_504815 [Parathielavia hyrcaniae]|uniref:Uncharacterized protein n=1 Tax=Parathielavia hyrcaniae TaxID=113614 RepID=A0AAN6T419_9PEZI|nr:hypothetical protein N658DRAFT_504815 [Parathielavia hyrcaniae]
MAMMFAPPGMPQGVRPGMVPRQYVFAPGAVPQGMQLQPVPPQMMQQPSQMLGGPAAYVMQPPPQPAQPVKEEKGWFGKLWRSESVKKPPTAGNDATNPANKLQKTAAHPQAPPVSPPPLYPANNKVSQGAPMPPHMMYPFQQGQQASHQQQQQQQPPQQQQQGVPPPTAPQFHPQHQQQHQQQQQQQQQPPQHQLHQHQAPLAWKTVSNGNGTGNGHSIGSGNRMPQFRTPNHNPGKSVIPPPEVRQAIQQQEQRLNPVRRESAGGAGGAGTPGQAQPHQGHGGQQQQVASSGPVSAQGNGMQSVVAAQAKIQGTGKVKIAGKPEAGKWGHANASAGGYDGSGWGDDDDGFS